MPYEFRQPQEAGRILSLPEIDRLTHFFLCHPHFHQNLESVLILIAFCNLFIINDQHHSKNEYDSKKDSKEEQTAVQSLVISLDAALLSVEAPKIGYLIPLIPVQPMH